jgi:hypothetical protein
MVGNIYIRGGSGNETNVGVTTFSSNIIVDGKALIGHNAAHSVGGGNSLIQVQATNSTGRISVVQHRNEAGGSPFITLGKSRGSSNASTTILQSGDEIGTFNWAGADGNDLDNQACCITGVVDGTPGSNDMPGRLEFRTTSDGSSTATTRMKISKEGYVTKPYHPCFRAGRSSDITPGSQNTIVFNYVANPTHFNQGGHYDNSTGAFTAPVAGIYNFYCQVLWEGLSSGQNMDDAFYIYYNSSGGASGGTLVSYDARRAEYIANETGNAGYYGAHSSVMVAMAAGGSVYIRNNRGSIVVHGNANFTFFQGYLIG